MFGHRFVLAALSAFLVGVIVTFAYLITTGMFSPAIDSVLNSSWAMEDKEQGQLVVTKETKTYKQNIYLCGDTEDTSVENAAPGLLGMGETDLHSIFSEADGWQVRFEGPQELVLARRINELCSEHKAYRHLGVYNNKLAVFQGPLGINTILLQVIENKSVDSLPETMQQKLRQAMDFTQQNSELQAELKQNFEFDTKKELYAVMENIDEFI
ncbi:MAG: hypothetical protein FH758_02550 [Firmicutes bacterium]|nr:hypothetical protein [Bacillota bacterium]